MKEFESILNPEQKSQFQKIKEQKNKEGILVINEEVIHKKTTQRHYKKNTKMILPFWYFLFYNFFKLDYYIYIVL